MDTIVLIAIIGSALLIYLKYAAIIAAKNRALEALAGIDVQLTKRSDLIPNVLKIAKRFMAHEKELISEVTALRAKTSGPYDPSDSAATKEHLDIASQLDSAMSRLMVSVEAYPELASDQTMLQAQQTYNEIEAQISAARRFYNSAVTELNNSIEIFPGSLIAGLTTAKTMPFYKADAANKAPVDADDILD